MQQDAAVNLGINRKTIPVGGPSTTHVCRHKWGCLTIVDLSRFSTNMSFSCHHAQKQTNLIHSNSLQKLLLFSCALRSLRRRGAHYTQIGLDPIFVQNMLPNVKRKSPKLMMFVVQIERG